MEKLDIVPLTVDEQKHIKIYYYAKKFFKKKTRFYAYMIENDKLWHIFQLPPWVCWSVPVDIKTVWLFWEVSKMYMYIILGHNSSKFNVSSMPKSNLCDLSIESLSEHFSSSHNWIGTFCPRKNWSTPVLLAAGNFMPKKGRCSLIRAEHGTYLEMGGLPGWYWDYSPCLQVYSCLKSWLTKIIIAQT